MEVINIRRSIRNYESRPVPEEKIDLLVRAAMQAPSAMNQQPWRILILEDRRILDSLAEELIYGKMLKKAPLALLMLADVRELPSPGRWPQDMAAATQNVLLQATKLGLGSVWVSLYPDDEREGHVRRLLELEEHLVPFSIVSLGYPKEKLRFVDRYDQAKILRR